MTGRRAVSLPGPGGIAPFCRSLQLPRHVLSRPAGAALLMVGRAFAALDQARRIWETGLRHSFFIKNSFVV